MENQNKYQTDRFSLLLSDLYEKDLDLRTYLRLLGFSEEQANHLVCDCLGEIKAAILEIIHTIFVMKRDGERLTGVVANRYGLTEIEGEVFVFNAGKTLDLHQHALKLLRDPKAKTFFENDLRNQLSNVLKKNPVRVKPSIETPIVEALKPVELPIPEENSAAFLEIRKDYQRAYMVWTDVEEAMLMDLIRQRKTTREIARQLQRNNGAIRSRIKKIKLRNP